MCYDRHLVWNMVAPIAVLVLIPLYVLHRHLFRARGEIEEEKGDGVVEKDDVNDELERKQTNGSRSRTVGSDDYTLTTTQHTRRSRLDSLDGSLTSIDYNQISYDSPLGKRVKEDEILPPTECAGPPPPADLDHVVTFHLPVGFYRLRKAMLGGESSFWTEVVLRDSLRYTRIKRGRWSKQHEHIGSPTPPDETTGVTENHFLNATRDISFQIPATMLIKASMAFETATLTHYSPHAFTISMQTLTPSVPFGSKIVNHTQITIINKYTDQDTIHTCKMTCSCETQFPTGPPMGFASKIKKESKLGMIDTFHKIAAAIRTCVEDERECQSNYSMGDADSFVYDLSLPGVTPTMGRKRAYVGSLKVMDSGDMPSFIFADIDEETSASKKKKKMSLNKRMWASGRKLLQNKSKRKQQKRRLSRRKRFETDTDFHYVSSLFP